MQEAPGGRPEETNSDPNSYSHPNSEPNPNSNPNPDADPDPNPHLNPNSNQVDLKKAQKQALAATKPTKASKSPGMPEP